MKISYLHKDIDKRKIVKEIGNLLMYYSDTSLRVEQGLHFLRNNERARDLLVNRLREGTGKTSITMDGILMALDTAVQSGGIFQFSVEGFKMDEKIRELIKDKQNVDIEIMMHDNYFMVEAMKSSALSFGGFRKKPGDSFEMYVKREKMKWMNWFESEMNKDFHPIKKVQRKILED